MAWRDSSTEVLFGTGAQPGAWRHQLVEEQLRIHGLHEVLVEACLPAAAPVLLSPIAGQRQQAYPRGGRVLRSWRATP